MNGYTAIQNERRSRGLCIRCGKEPLVTRNHGEKCRVLTWRSRIALIATTQAEQDVRLQAVSDRDAEIRRSLEPLEDIAARFRIPLSEVVRVRYGRRREEQESA